MLAALKQLFSPRALKDQAQEAYVQAVSQARNPVFYRDWQVEDTVDGRFDIIVLHLFLILTRCEEEGSDSDIESFHRYVSETFFADMDRSLREMGVGDTGVGVRIKKMAQAFYGRMKAYRDAMGSETALAEALRRNVYREKEIPAQVVASLAAYVGRNQQALRLQSVDELLQGNIRFSS